MRTNQLMNTVAGGEVESLEAIGDHFLARTQIAKGDKRPAKSKPSTPVAKFKAAPAAKTAKESPQIVAMKAKTKQLCSLNDQLRNYVAEMTTKLAKRIAELEQAGLSPGLAKFAIGNKLPR